MKKIIKSISILLSLCFVFASLFSCNDIVGLGEKLDIEGPVITITDPPPRKPVNTTFILEGTASDNTGIDVLLVKIVINNQELSRQWRYNNSGWQITDNKGENWAAYTSPYNSWQGSLRNGVWKLEINLPQDSQNGEYTIVVQAWDITGFSDENSYKTRVVIIDNDPPKVNITDPYLYLEYGKDNKVPDTDVLFTAGDDDIGVMRDPANIGKFISKDFNLQYQIDDNSDVWSVEIRLYNNGDPEVGVIDEDSQTPLPDKYIFKYNDNIGPPPFEPVPGGNIKPNGTIKVPALDDPSITNKITEKTTVVVVGLCYDAAGNINQEKILGCFIYWPKSRDPWITFSEGMKEKSGYVDKSEVYMVYPGREIKATAFQSYGVTRVDYKIYSHGDDFDAPGTHSRDGTMANEQRFGGIYSTVFSWSFLPPSSTGLYTIKAKAYGYGEVTSDDYYEAMFFVQDVSYPDFTREPSPLASKPLFESIGRPDEFGNATGSNKIRIHGEVSDATAVESVYLVWINPESKGYAAMSQLQYFRDSGYEGWTKADALPASVYPAAGTPAEENIYDTGKPNKVWKVPIKYEGKDIETGREVYRYSQEIDITDALNIAGAYPKDQPLKSQIFLLRAKNPDGKCTVITYAPQGDESPPSIPYNRTTVDGTEVRYQIKVTVSGSQSKICYSGNYNLIEQFKTGDKITVEGEWEEDSIEFLNFETYLKNNFEITINGYEIDGLGGTSLTFTPLAGTANPPKGTWKAEATLGSGSSYKLLADGIKDTLVVSVKVKDIGGNITEAGGSWLIRSDTLRLLRISSEFADTKYNASPNPTVGKNPIRLFLEFNKPVELVNSSARPQLQLNVTGGAVRTAKYEEVQGTQSTRQYFEYIIEAGHSTSDPVLDVTGLVGVTGTDASSYWQNSSYDYTWFTGSGIDREEIRILLPNSSHVTGDIDANGYYITRLPVYSNTADRIYSLRGGKNIEIDTTPPTVTSIVSTNPAGFYAKDAEIFIDVTFSENVQITSGTPVLNLQLRNSSNPSAPVSSPTNGSVKVNANKISFTYKIQSGDTTAGYPIVVTGFTGNIADIAGNALTSTGFGSSPSNLNGTADAVIRGVETVTPDAPVVKILTAGANTWNDTTVNVVSNTVGGSPIYGFSTGAGTPETSWGLDGPAPKALSYLYNDNLWLAIDGNVPTTPITQTQKLGALEYSLDNGKNWVRADFTLANRYFILPLTRMGEYKITARQIDKAGNVSNWAQPVTLNWDKGDFVTSITSTSANGTYSDTTSPNTINIRVNFRKPLAFAAAPALTLNARVSSGGAFITLNTADAISGARTYLDYTYTVQPGHTTTGANLDVTGISGASATDGATSSTGVNVSSRITMPPAGDARLGTNKTIKVDTSPLTVTAGPVFAGSLQADGSWAGTVKMTFSNDISKGTGNIRVEQAIGANAATYYRLPAVLTEAQYDKLKNASGISANINTFYTRGTNGYNVTTGVSDTSTKYILRYEYDTANITPDSSAAAGSIGKFADDMRKAEAVELNIYMNAVSISGKELTITLTGSNVLQVPGASYTVSYPDGFVQDSLGHLIAANTTTPVAITGVAKPFIRIKKSHDTISTQTGSISAPIYVAVQPITSEARMDCRTPGASIIYRYQTTVTDVTARNWAANTTGDNGTAIGNTRPAHHDNLTTDNPAPAKLGNPRTDTTANNNTTATYSSPFILPIRNAANTGYENDTENNRAVADYQGYQWLVRAVGRTGTAGNYSYSDDSEEIAYRSVLSYQITGMAASGAGTSQYGFQLTDGEQIWVRGGDAVSSSTTPGFPLTWSDDWNVADALSGRRAGIRLLTMMANTTENGATAVANVNTASIWKWVTWEVNVPVYFDMIRGSNLTNTAYDAAVAWQYGPREVSYQRAGWTSYKEDYKMLPGKHRYLFVVAGAFEGKGNVNFSGTYAARKDFTANNGWTGANTADATPQ
jgi:hypothetical protein